MARAFTTREAKEIILLHRDLTKRAGAAAAVPVKLMGDVSHAADSCLSDGRMAAAVCRALAGEEAAEALREETSDLAQALQHYIDIYPAAALCSSILNEQKAAVDSDIAALEQSGNSLQWIFLPRESREKAENAYHALYDLYTGNYGTKLNLLIEEIGKQRRYSADGALAALSAEPETYAGAMKQIRSDAFTRGTLPQIQALQAYYGGVTEAFSLADRSFDADRTAVLRAVSRLVSDEVQKILQGIPMDEFAKGGTGIRIKSLKDEGFLTAADVYSAYRYRLEQVKGISEEGSKQLKQMAEDYAGEVRQGVKVKLSADNRTTGAELLITALWQYMRKQAAAEELKRTREEFGSALAEALKRLKRVGNGLIWIFLTPSVQRDLSRAYSYLTGLRGNEALSRTDALARILSGTAPAPSGDLVWADFEKNSIRYYTLLEQLAPGVLGNDDTLYGLPEELAREIEEEEVHPAGLNCTLRRYQEWGVKYALHQEKILLGDEMGLGKTIQAIGVMVSLSNTGATHFMVVCPASVISNWCREIRKQSTLEVIRVHGNTRKGAFQIWLEEGGVCVTTYETTAGLKLEDNFHFSMLVVDEAHYIKNPDAQRTINVKKLCSHTDRLMFMTGTALENKVDEMIALVRILRPEIADQLEGIAFMSSAPQFRNKIAPVYYRRKREDVLTELPDLVESREWCTLSKEEEKVYEQAVLEKQYAAARRLSWNIPDLKKSAKARRLAEIMEEAESDGRKVLVFSFFLETIRKIADMLGEKCMQPINGSVSPERRQQIIDEFEKAPAGSVLAAQIQSGGTGLNIQCASVVVICEPQLKPSVENQAIARAYRMGQARNVLVYRLLADDTIDEKITDLLESKQQVFDAFADKSAAAESFEVDDSTLGDIIQEEIDRINAKNGTEENSGETDLQGSDISEDKIEAGSESGSADGTGSAGYAQGTPL